MTMIDWLLLYFLVIGVGFISGLVMKDESGCD